MYEVRDLYCNSQGLNGTTSDFDGNFSLDISDEDAILEISFIGFTSQTISVSNSDNIQVSLVASRSALDEVVLTGYGSTLKRELVSSISQVSALFKKYL